MNNKYCHFLVLDEVAKLTYISIALRLREETATLVLRSKGWAICG